MVTLSGPEAFPFFSWLIAFIKYFLSIVLNSISFLCVMCCKQLSPCLVSMLLASFGPTTGSDRYKVKIQSFQHITPFSINHENSRQDYYIQILPLSKLSRSLLKVTRQKTENVHLWHKTLFHIEVMMYNDVTVSWAILSFANLKTKTA